MKRILFIIPILFLIGKVYAANRVVNLTKEFRPVALFIINLHCIKRARIGTMRMLVYKSNKDYMVLF